MEAAVQQTGLEGRHRETGQHAIGHRGLESLLDRRDELLRNIATLDFVHELGTVPDHLFHRAVLQELPIFIAVYAVFFILTAIGISAEDIIC